MGAPLIQGSEGQYTGSPLPARPIAGQSSIRVAYRKGIAIDEPIEMHHDMGATRVCLPGKKDPCTTTGTRQDRVGWQTTAYLPIAPPATFKGIKRRSRLVLRTCRG